MHCRDAKGDLAGPGVADCRIFQPAPGLISWLNSEGFPVLRSKEIEPGLLVTWGGKMLSASFCWGPTVGCSQHKTLANISASDCAAKPGD